MDNQDVLKGKKSSAGLLRRFRRGLTREEGWNFMEATLSVALLTVLFLGLTITLMAFREWMTRSWAIRVMDQYANDVASNLHEKLVNAHSIGTNPSQYGLGAFKISIINFDFSNPTNPFIDSTVYNYSARPGSGIYCAIGNTAPQKLDPDFPPPGWNNKHRFAFTEFGWLGPYSEIGRTPSFSWPMVRIVFSIQYLRPRVVEVPGGLASQSFVLEKRYVISDFLKNFTLATE